MEYLVDILTKKPSLLSDLFNKKVNISVKVDGSAFQISNENDTIDYHKRGGSSSKLGPVIDDYTKLFAAHLNKAIDYFDKYQSVIKEEGYKFLAVELLENGSYVLLNVIDKDDNLISAGDDLNDIASKFEIYSVPLLFDGVLDGKMDNPLLDMCTLSEDTSNEEFKKLLFDIFKVDNKKYKELLKAEEIEGIVLTWDLNGKIAQYKIINPAFKKRHEAEQAAAKEKAEKNSENLAKLIQLLTDKLENEGEKLDENHLRSLELNFLKFISDPKFLNKLINTSAKVTPNENKFFSLQVNKTSKEMQKVLKKHGTPLITAYEQFLMTFNKERKRSFIISKEFQDRINNLITKI